MIAVEVGDEHRVNPAKRLNIIERADPSQVRHAVPECRIGENPPAVELNEDGAVAYPGDGVAHESRSRSLKLQRANPVSAPGGPTADGPSVIAFGKQAIKNRTNRRGRAPTCPPLPSP